MSSSRFREGFVPNACMQASDVTSRFICFLLRVRKVMSALTLESQEKTGRETDITFLTLNSPVSDRCKKARAAIPLLIPTGSRTVTWPPGRITRTGHAGSSTGDHTTHGYQAHRSSASTSPRPTSTRPSGQAPRRRPATPTTSPASPPWSPDSSRSPRPWSSSRPPAAWNCPWSPPCRSPRSRSRRSTPARPATSPRRRAGSPRPTGSTPRSWPTSPRRSAPTPGRCPRPRSGPWTPCCPAASSCWRCA